ncbi:MAG: hypothetical protein AABX13_00230 [Nanoarchaeota archaeon]
MITELRHSVPLPFRSTNKFATEEQPAAASPPAPSSALESGSITFFHNLYKSSTTVERL